MQKYNVNIQKGKIGDNGLASVTGWVKCYLANPVTREYMGSTMEYVMFDVSLSAGAYLDEPPLPEKENQAVRRREDGSAWEIVDDYRDLTAYNTQTKQPIIIDFMGALPESLTLLKPNSEFDKWDGKKWIVDTEAQKAALITQIEQEKSRRLDEAGNTIAYLQEAVDVDLATEEEVVALQKWKKYRVLLNRVDASSTTDIEWPQKPE
ncbi:TPA: tail fiber assembly protein [Proteus mirabilis]|uniref:tail fiber assembly protein n=1 Tax=Enterobacterales TaxID=91347 RepID=UPI00073CAA36|nr:MULTISPECIES: tail fiber assembly protein [Enterobacterales]ELZ9636336.1 tail fiber assembly protein [Proteus mirabilis]KSW17518.1 tail assembly protein [Proteus mirabilis]MBG2799129.1 tail fiber assembly protein [Proteus mirabilis]MBG3110719.1 tail fiber assembly protein [Proteus mirabilis]MBS3844220.1 tail fiber assembly protein [Proteus mirabilis]